MVVVLGGGGRYREHHMEIARGEQIGLARRQPLARGRSPALGAVSVPVGVVGDARMAAALAGFDIAAEHRGAAGLDGRQYLELAEADVTCMKGSPGLHRAGERCRRSPMRDVPPDQCPVSAPSISSLRRSSGLVTARRLVAGTSRDPRDMRRWTLMLGGSAQPAQALALLSSCTLPLRRPSRESGFGRHEPIPRLSCVPLDGCEKLTANLPGGAG